jgi:hypothetical protein
MALSSGCATLFAPGPDKLQVNSTPSGARVFLDSQEVGRTPALLTLDRKLHQGVIRVEAPGYQPAIAQRPKAFNGIAVLNCLGLVPWIVDLATGNYEKFDTTPVQVSLVPAYAPPGGQPPPGYPAPPYPQQAPPPGAWGPPPGAPPPAPAPAPQPPAPPAPAPAQPH